MGLWMGGGGVPMSHVDFYKMAESHLPVSYFVLVPLSILRNVYVTYHYKLSTFCHVPIELY